MATVTTYSICTNCNGEFHRDSIGQTQCKQCLFGDAYKDQVEQPSHYLTDGMECIDAIRSALGPDGFRAYCRGCAMKYVWRAGKKGDSKTDLAKAAKYLEFAITK